MRKKKILPLIAFFTLSLGLITSCADGSNPTSDSQDIITGVEIGGASSVNINKTVKLIADVIGSDDDSVIWSSDNNSIATIDSNGIVTGISEGTAIITAKSAAEPQYFGTKTITVVSERATSLSIEVEEIPGVEKINNSTYNIPLGKEIELTFKTNPLDARTPDDISIEITPPSNIPSSQFVISRDEMNITKATFVAYSPANNVVLKVTGNYTGYTTNPLITSVSFNILDTQAENRSKLIEKIEKYSSSAEILVSEAQIYTNYLDAKEDLNYETDTHINSYIEATYTVKTTTLNDSEYSSNYYYSGKDEKLNKFYCFEYDNNTKEVSDVFFVEDLDANDNRSSLMFEKTNAGNVFGLSNKILNILQNAAEPQLNIVSFESQLAYVNSIYTITEDTYHIDSDFENPENDRKYSMDFDISFDKDGRLTSYSFSETVFKNDEVIYQYLERLESIKYDSKKSNDSSTPYYINTYLYYLKSFILEECNEKTEFYDYSDSSKYGAQQVDVIDGVTKYTVLKNKTLILKIKNTEILSKANLSIDRVKASSSNKDCIEDPILSGNNIFAINPYKDPATAELTLGSATITFTSTLGYTYKIIVEFVESELLSVFATRTPNNNDFGDVFQGRDSSYFYINTDPDEDKYEFYLDVVEGSSDGIELIHYSYDFTFGYTDFTYAVRGIKLGSYKFRIGVVGSFLTTSDYYTINVIEPYTSEYLEEQLVNEDTSYFYTTGTLTTTLKFISNNQFEMTTEMLGSESVSTTINYKLETGKILIPSTQILKEGMYFGQISEGEILFNNDLTRLTLLLSISYDGDTNIHYSPFEFKKYIDMSDIPNYVNGNSYSSEFFLVGNGNSRASLDLTKNSGVLIINNKDGDEILNVSFSYSYDTRATAMYLSDIEYATRANPNYFIDDEIYFHSGYGQLEVKFYTDEYSYEKITFVL